jgi:carbon monoxide dehydrogenase subunit G
MDITQQFSVDRPIEGVWSLFKDVPELARCLPGAELTNDNGDGTYDGKVSVKLGPIAASFEGTARVTFDDEAYASNIKGRGVDRSGGSQGSVDVDVRLSEADSSSTDVSIAATVTLAGPIAQFGRTGLVNEVSKRLIDEFSACLHAKLDAGTAEDAAVITAPEVRGLSLFLASTWAAFIGWLKGRFSRSRE